VDKKIQIIDLIINKEVQEYKMRMHYSVENGVFLKGFQQHKENVEDLFHQVVRRVYVLMFETIKRRILYPEEEK
jgi:cyclopropane fatty-acyl-phospholipid synthase-like methyltransferase